MPAPVAVPPGSVALDYELEIAAVVGRGGADLSPAEAGAHLAGYVLFCDWSARDLQGADKQWARAKGSDTFCPLGPWMVTHMSVAEASDLRVTTTVDDELRQDGSTSQMVHGIAELVAYISSYTTLLPGDVILTGTPSGVGPMRPGQEVTVSIEGIGDLTNVVVSGTTAGSSNDSDNSGTGADQ